MTKEEILEKSRNENKNVDFYEYEVRNKATILSSSVGIPLCLFFYILLLIIKNESHSEIFVIVSAMETVLFGYKYLKLRQKHELFVTLIYAIVLIVSLCLFIGRLIVR